MKQPVFLKLTEGCYGRLRNGEIVGPLVQNSITNYITIRSNRVWWPTGMYSALDHPEQSIIEITPEPEKLPLDDEENGG